MKTLFDSIYYEFLRILAFILMALIPVYVIAMKWRILQKKRQLAQLDDPLRIVSSSDPLIEDPELLKKAEEEVNKHPLDIREKLLEYHTLLERYTTLRGYTQSYMEELVNTLNENGISADYHFQQSMPLGYNSISQYQGIFELYVLREQADQAREVIKAWENR